MAACVECGYEYERLDHDQIIDAVASFAESFVQLLSSVPDDRVRAQPRGGSWSVLEYGCHMRDVLRFQRDRVAAAQASDTPEFTSMRRDERAIEERYNEQDPLAVARELMNSARQLAVTLDDLDEAGWQRTGVYPWPVRAVRTVEWIGQRTAHELAHHLFDCERLLAS